LINITFYKFEVNASDNKIRDPNMTTIKIWLNKEDNMIKIYNNGKGTIWLFKNEFSIIWKKYFYLQINSD
jgi:DNA gyrase/topoisomerase IV subunit B